MAFYQKYRSKNFSDLIGQDHVSKTLIEAIKSGKLSHAYLLTGPRGTGKTSTARLLAKAINCLELSSADGKEKNKGEACNSCESCREILDGRSVDVIEIDAASHTGVDDIRDLIEKAAFAPVKALKKVYIIDEVHMLSKNAFNALLKTLEEPPNHVVFILATTEAHKLPSTILSRTQRYDFKRVGKKDIIINLKKIAKQEKIEIDDSALEIIAIAAEGGHRDAIGLMEKVASFSGKITIDDVENILGIAKSEELLALIGAIFNKNPEEGLKIAQRLYENGADIIQFQSEIIEMLRKILILTVAGEPLFETTEENLKEIKKLSNKVDKEGVVKIIESFLSAGQLLKNASYPLLPIEMAIIESSSAVSPTMPRLRGASSQQSADSKIQKTKDRRQYTEDSIQKTNNGQSSVAPVLEMAPDFWQKVIEETKKENFMLAAYLRDAKLTKVEGEKMVVGFKFKLHKETILEPKNCLIIEKIMSRLNGSKIRLKCELLRSGKSDGEIKPKADNIDLQKAAEEIFT